MISLILPYWQRQAATDTALRLIAARYFDLDLEIVMVDDGSAEPFIAPKSWGLNLKVVTLPAKSYPLNPCVPYNEGVKASRGSYIALSNPEILHNAPVLADLRAAITDDLDYVMAAAWSAEQKRWHCHSSLRRRDDTDVGAYIPAGADYHFMSMMKRSLWDKIGGFDEDYRLGAGYDDPDLVRRLHKAGAKFVMRDDLAVEHPRNGAHSAWTGDMFARNRKLFLSKWDPL